jgi:hypothetical protein
LERAAAEGLPPIAWTVAPAGIELRGECLAHPMDARHDAFHTWRAAVGTWAGQIADHESEHGRRRLDPAGGSVARGNDGGHARPGRDHHPDR